MAFLRRSELFPLLGESKNQFWFNELNCEMGSEINFTFLILLLRPENFFLPVLCHRCGAFFRKEKFYNELKIKQKMSDFIFS
jgi:hypothetical protein